MLGNDLVESLCSEINEVKKMGKQNIHSYFHKKK